MTEGRSHRLGDLLREAREAKGADLARVERETKIRERYLSALERGEYRELPGAVYTKGFLRNYGSYLGLDPEYLIDLYRIETTSAAEPRVAAPPRPLRVRRARAFVITPGALVAAILTIGVGAFVAYLAFEIVNFARTPELRITQPPGDVIGYTRDRITIRGVTAPHATVRVGNLRENPTVTADEEGRFEVVVGLVPGSNVVELTAEDRQTGRSSATESRRIIVGAEPSASPTPEATLAVAQPEAGAAISGPVAIRGSAAADAAVAVAAELVEVAPPSFTVSDASGAEIDVDPARPRPPDPVSLAAADDGAWETSLRLEPGRWRIIVTAEGAQPVEREVAVAANDGLRGTLRLTGDSYLEIDQDGDPLNDVSGRIASEGERIQVVADEQLRIRAGNAAAVRVTINGIRIGAMGAPGAVVEWRIQGTGG